MSREFPDRREVLFGRGKDLSILSRQIRRKGLTALVGKAKTGKTWFVTELCRTISHESNMKIRGQRYGAKDMEPGLGIDN